MNKYVNLPINQRQSSLAFLDRSRVPRKSEATYRGNSDRHGRQGLAQAWRSEPDCADLLVKSSNIKVFYGLESIQLTKAEKARIDALQMNMLRRIQQVPRANVNREWTNLAVIEALQRTAQYEHEQLSEKWKKKKITLLGHILRSQNSDPLRQVLFESYTNCPRIDRMSRVGKPRAEWLHETCRETHETWDPHTQFDIEHRLQMAQLAVRAQARQFPD